MDHPHLLKAISDFLDGIGIPVVEKQLPADTFLPGLQIDRGALAIDPQKLQYVGDMLHEAGHIAVMAPSQRKDRFADAGPEMGEEIAAQAWSYAAALACDIPPEVVLHDNGYKGGGSHLAKIYREGHWPGVPLLAWMGLTGMPEAEGEQAKPKFPAMKKWLRDLDDPSRHP